ncbi:MAG: co-chaperone GroES [Candidatus Coatesbacteria bacterium]|jgi:chaperonin GroES|nr:co-chaperone GroES [Candidatus Coatesbacteria bacterium]
MAFKPLGDRVLVKRLEKEEQTTAGGIIIPDTAKEKPQRGKIVSVGEGKRTDDGSLLNPRIKEGQEVLFGKYTGTEVKIDDEEYVIMREDDILGVIE